MKYLSICFLVICSISVIYSTHSLINLKDENTPILNNTCPKFTCDNPEKSACAIKKDLGDRINLQVSECDKNQYCPYYSGLNRSQVSCVESTKNLKSYPGGSCVFDSDCVLNATCKDNICINKEDGQECFSHGECKIGSSCYKKTCRPQGDANQICDSDYDCQNTMGCDNTGKCQAYFSLENGSKSSINVIGLSLCKTGPSLTGECDTFKLTSDVDCTNTGVCKYKDTKGVEHDINSECKCGYDGKRYCQTFNSDSQDFTDYSSKRIQVLKNPKCHTEERIICKDTIEDETKLSSTLDYVKSSIKIFEAQNFANLDEKDKSCVMSVVYPILKNSPGPIPPPVNDYCPAFSCADRDSNKMNCIEEKLDKKTNLNSFVLSKCYRYERCMYDPLMLNKDASKYTADCQEKEKRKDNSVLPGEKCTKDDECLQIILPDGKTNLKKCTDDGVCKGVDNGQNCSDNIQCTAGSFCDISNTKKCVSQLDKGKDCTRTSECKNDLACNGKCGDYNSVEVGTKLATSKDNIDDHAKYNCKTGVAFSDGTCAERSYADTSKIIDGVVKCDAGSNCDYIYKAGDRQEAQKLACVCGYNSDGQGYCPYSTDKVNSDKFSKLMGLYKSGSNCHTDNRLGCEDIDKTADWVNNRAQGDIKFYKAPACVANVLLSSNILSVSVFLLALVMFSMF